MSPRADSTAEMERAVEEAGDLDQANRKDRQSVRRQQAMTFRLAGMSYEQIGERMDLTTNGARALVERALDRAENRNVETMRELENARLDRAQAVIWPQVLRGDLKALDAYLRISDRRAKINGLNAPTRIDLSMSVRTEMEQALGQLESLVLQGETVDEAAEDQQDPQQDHPQLTAAPEHYDERREYRPDDMLDTLEEIADERPVD